MDNLKGRKVLVAGGGGFLGAHICRTLLQAGADVTIFDIIPVNVMHNVNDIKTKVKIITGSVTDEKLVFMAMQGMDAVVDVSFPLAKCDPGPGNQYIEVGTVGVFNILKAAFSQGAQVIFASSISVYGVQRYTPIDEKHPAEPMLLYGATKLAGEKYCSIMCRNHGCKVVILRFSDLYGPGDGRNGAPVAFLKKAVEGAPISIRSDGKQVRSYLFITDAAQAVACALINFKQGGVFNIAGCEAMSIYELAEVVRRVTGKNVPIEFITESASDPRKYIIDGTLAGKEIGFNPQVNMIDGLSKTLEWLNSTTVCSSRN